MTASEKYVYLVKNGVRRRYREGSTAYRALLKEKVKADPTFQLPTGYTKTRKGNIVKTRERREAEREMKKDREEALANARFPNLAPSEFTHNIRGRSERVRELNQLMSIFRKYASNWKRNTYESLPNLVRYSTRHPIYTDNKEVTPFQDALNTFEAKNILEVAF